MILAEELGRPMRPGEVASYLGDSLHMVKEGFRPP